MQISLALHHKLIKSLQQPFRKPWLFMEVLKAFNFHIIVEQQIELQCLADQKKISCQLV